MYIYILYIITIINFLSCGYYTFVGNNLTCDLDYYYLFYYDGFVPIRRKIERNRAIRRNITFEKGGEEFKLEIPKDMKSHFTNYILDSDMINYYSIFGKHLCREETDDRSNNIDIVKHFLSDQEEKVRSFKYVKYLNVIIFSSFMTHSLHCLYYKELMMFILDVLVLIMSNISMHEIYDKYSVLLIKFNGFRQRLYIVN